jgi:Secretion system C-terminal sorting domain
MVVPQTLGFNPNPSSGTIQIGGSLNLQGSSLSVINTLGAVVYQSTPSSATVTLPGSIPSGIYFIQLKTNDGKIYSGKLLLNR